MKIPSLLLVSAVVGAAAGNSEDICIQCECSLLDIRFNDKLSRVKADWEYAAGDVRGWSPLTPVPDTAGEYLGVNCSSGRIASKWPPIGAAGVWGHFDGNALHELPNFPESIKRKMLRLSLAGNGISELSPSDFEDYHSLAILDLSRNKIRHVGEASFSHLRNLHKLDLSWNQIDQVGKWLPDSNLRYANLASNAITVVRADALLGFKNLEFLDLSNNILSSLPDNFGSSLLSLKFLHLTGNQFEAVPRLPRSLAALDISSNVLRTLVLPQIDDLFVLDASNNNLDDLDNVYDQLSLKVLRVSHNYMSRVGVMRSSQLKVLDLSYNNFKIIPEGINSEKLPHLQELYLDGNPLNEIAHHGASRKPFADLDVLGLSHLGNLTHIDQQSLQGIIVESYVNCSEESGVFVNLSSNKLKEIDADTFKRFPICSIDLSHNRLTAIPRDLFKWQNLTSANLQNNPWNCICDLQWMLDLFVPHFYERKPQLLLDLRCAMPSRFKSRMFVYWLNATGQVLCKGPSYYQYEYSDGKYFEMWTVSVIASIILGVLILIVTIAILVLLFVRPARTKNTEKKIRSKPLFSELRINSDHKYNEIRSSCAE